MLSNKEAEVKLFGENMKASIPKVCPQVGLLYHLLWNLVINELLGMLNGKGFHAQGSAGDSHLHNMQICQITELPSFP